MIYFCVKFQKDPLFGVNFTFFAPWLPWQRPPLYHMPCEIVPLMDDFFKMAVIAMETAKC
jgi:hypothetical protein